MCECCGGDCRLCSGDKGFLEFPEPITKVYVREVVDKNGCSLEEMIINDKYKVTPTGNPDSPFRKEEMKQPLNEAYQNEILESYQKISDTFDDFTQLMRSRVPYESWPKHCQIAGINPELLGPADPPGTYIQQKFDKPPVPMPIPDFTERTSNQLEDKMISRIKDLGRAQEKLKMILDDEIFDRLSKHNPYWDSKYEPEGDKLDDLRRKFSCLSDNLWDIMGILRTEEES